MATAGVNRMRRRSLDADEERRGEAARSRPDADPPAADDPGFAHLPVMRTEVLHYLRPGPGETVVDATVGFGGHAAAILGCLGAGGRLVAVDRDPDACAAARRRLAPEAERLGARCDVVQANFSDLEAVLDGLGLGLVDAVLFDCGVSSPQLDRPDRGFSYRADAPLDMRMDPTQGTTAYHLVNGLSEEELADILRRFGQERWSRRIANFIVRRRQERGLIQTTGELVEIIKQAVPAGARRDGPHPARRTFQALRIAVNNELGALEAGLEAAVRRLHPGGRVVALSFHSLEDRIVKHVFRSLAAGCTCPPDWPVCRCGAQPTLQPLLQRPLAAGAAEAQANPRARSAKLRAGVRLAPPPPGGRPGPRAAEAGTLDPGPRGAIRPIEAPGTAAGLAGALAGAVAAWAEPAAWWSPEARGRIAPVAGGVRLVSPGVPSVAETLAHGRPGAARRSRRPTRPAPSGGRGPARPPVLALPVLASRKGE